MRLGLQELGLERYEAAFREADIAPAILPELTDRDLAELGVAPSHRRLLLKAIRALSPDPVDHRQENAALPSPMAARPAFFSRAERRQLTVLFCDLNGSTDLAARLDPRT